MPKQSDTLGDLISDIANRKRRAAQARFGRGPVGGDKPQDVYLAGCAAVGEAFAADGYRFAPSGPHFSRRLGDLVFKVSFQSSFNNVAGEYVAMWIHAYIYSPAIKKWGAQHQMPVPSDFVAGGQIGNLLEHPSWMKWNLANPANRQTEIGNAIKTVRDVALPFFSAFEDTSAVIERLRRGNIPSMGLLAAFGFAACFGSISIAREIAIAFLMRRPDLRDQYLEKFRTFELQGLPDDLRGYAEVLGALSVRFQLGDLSGSAT